MNKNWDTSIELIYNEFGDWEVLKVDGEVFHQGHYVDFPELLRYLGYNFKEVCISNEEMEKLYG